MGEVEEFPSQAQSLDFVHAPEFFHKFQHGSSSLALGQGGGRRAFCCDRRALVGSGVHPFRTVALDVAGSVAHEAPAFSSLRGFRIIEWWECRSDSGGRNDGPWWGSAFLD